MDVIDKVMSSIGAIIFLYVILLFVFVLPSCSEVESSNNIEIISHVESPDNKLIAVEYLSMGGGALGFCSRAISILKSNSEMPSDYYNPTHIFAARCGVDVSITWLDVNEIRVNYNTKDFKQPNVVLNPNGTNDIVSVEYEHDT